MDVGNRVRALRKKRGLTMQELADKVGVSYTTLYRLETGQQSPSVATLADIAQQLGQPIASFLTSTKPDIHMFKREDNIFVDSAGLKLHMIVPFGIINDDISINFGKLEAGQRIDEHRNSGFEFAFVMSGECVFIHDGKPHEMRAHDAIFFSGEKVHAVEVKESIEFLAILFKNIK